MALPLGLPAKAAKSAAVCKCAPKSRRRSCCTRRSEAGSRGAEKSSDRTSPLTRTSLSARSASSSRRPARSSVARRKNSSVDLDHSVCERARAARRGESSSSNRRGFSANQPLQERLCSGDAASRLRCHESETLQLRNSRRLSGVPRPASARRRLGFRFPECSPKRPEKTARRRRRRVRCEERTARAVRGFR